MYCQADIVLTNKAKPGLTLPELLHGLQDIPVRITQPYRTASCWLFTCTKVFLVLV